MRSAYRSKIKKSLYNQLHEDQIMNVGINETKGVHLKMNDYYETDDSMYINLPSPNQSQQNVIHQSNWNESNEFNEQNEVNVNTMPMWPMIERYLSTKKCPNKRYSDSFQQISFYNKIVGFLISQFLI